MADPCQEEKQHMTREVRGYRAGKPRTRLTPALPQCHRPSAGCGSGCGRSQRSSSPCTSQRGARC